MAASDIMYEVDKIDNKRVWWNGEVIGQMKMFILTEKENYCRKMVVSLWKNPAQTEFVWVKDIEGIMWRALVTAGFCDLQTITEKLQCMME